MSARAKFVINATTRRAATQSEKMPMGHAALLGTVITPKSRSAYVQLSPGRVRRVRMGDIVDGAKITKIDNGVVMMARGDDLRRLRVPGQ